jgi:DNA-binding HxlR family transcriptional regulator
MTVEELTVLVRQHLKSVWALEILLHLREQPGRIRSAQKIVSELRATTALVENTLESLERSGLIALHEAGYSFQPASPVLAKFCEELAAIYRERPVALINLISAPGDQGRAVADDAAPSPSGE